MFTSCLCSVTVRAVVPAEAFALYVAAAAAAILLRECPSEIDPPPPVRLAPVQAPDVRAAFKDIARTVGGRSDAAAESWLGGLLEGNRYLEDVWAG
jgi:hypothetical protein